jgi:hypothetical protein
MIQREKYRIANAQNHAFLAYLDFCIATNEVPRRDLVSALSGCTDSSKLQEITALHKQKTADFQSKTTDK